MNAAFFDYQYQDIHGQVINGETGTTNQVSGQEATVRGIELELNAALTSNLTLNSGFVYLIDRKYDEFSVPANPLGNYPAIEASGNTIVGAPEISAIFGLQHEFSLEHSGNISSNLSVSYNSGVYYDLTNLSGSGGYKDDGSYTLVNLRTTYHAPSDSWTFALWVNNLLDEYYFMGGLNATGGASDFESVFGVEGIPRLYGATVGYNF